MNTHPEQWAAIYAAAPGEQLGVRCLAQGHLSRGIEGGESAVHASHEATTSPCEAGLGKKVQSSPVIALLLLFVSGRASAGRRRRGVILRLHITGHNDPAGDSAQ